MVAVSYFIMINQKIQFKIMVFVNRVEEKRAVNLRGSVHGSAHLYIYFSLAFI